MEKIVNIFNNVSTKEYYVNMHINILNIPILILFIYYIEYNDKLSLIIIYSLIRIQSYLIRLNLDTLSNIAFKKLFCDTSTKKSDTFRYSFIITLMGVLCININS